MGWKCKCGCDNDDKLTACRACNYPKNRLGVKGPGTGELGYDPSKAIDDQIETVEKKEVRPSTPPTKTPPGQVTEQQKKPGVSNPQVTPTGTNPGTKPPGTKPPETKPPETKPPETKPPETKPPEKSRTDNKPSTPLTTGGQKLPVGRRDMGPPSTKTTPSSSTKTPSSLERTKEPPPPQNTPPQKTPPQKTPSQETPSTRKENLSTPTLVELTKINKRNSVKITELNLLPRDQKALERLDSLQRPVTNLLFKFSQSTVSKENSEKNLIQAQKEYDNALEAFNTAKKKEALCRQEYEQTIKNPAQDENPEVAKKLQAMKLELKKTALDNAINTFEPLKEPLKKAIGKLKQAKIEYSEFIAKDRLLDNLRFGPLSQPPVGQLNPEQLESILNLYKTEPELTDFALDLVGAIKDPAVLVEGVKVISELLSSGKLGTPRETALARAQNALKLGCTLDITYFKRMKAYYGTDGPTKPNPLKTDQGVQAQGVVYSRAIAEKLVKNGTIDFGNATDELNLLHFHPTSLDSPMWALASTVENFRNETQKSPVYNNLLGTIKSPAPGSQTLIQKTLGKKPEQKVTAQDGKVAVVSAMLVPIFQGNVGNCHANSVCLKYRANDPESMMKDLVQMVSTGKLQKGKRPPVPIIQTIADKEHTLLRSWEFTVATCAIRLDNNNNKSFLSEGLFETFLKTVDSKSKSLSSGLNDLQDAIDKILPKPPSWEELKNKMVAKLSDLFEYNYNPTGEFFKKGIGDGQSSKGRKDLLLKGTNIIVDSESVYKEKVFEAIAQVLKSSGASSCVETAKKIIYSSQFDTFLKEANNDEPPWNKSAGGRSEYENEVLYPEKQQQQVKLRGPSSKESSSVEPHQKTRDIFEKVIKGIVPKSDTSEQDYEKDLVSLGIEGSHDINMLRSHPSLKKLHSGGPEKIQQNIDEMLIKQGEQIAKSSVDKEKLAYVYNKLVDQFGLKLKGKQNPPEKAMTPGEFMKWLRDAIDRNQLFFPNDRLEPFLRKELGYPEFVFGDLNWGDMEDHWLIAVTSDIQSGKPIMIKKEKFSGETSPTLPGWLDLGWEAILMD